MKKPLSYAQRLALHVHSSVSSNMKDVCMPYGFEAYASCAAKCMGKKLSHNWY